MRRLFALLFVLVAVPASAQIGIPPATIAPPVIVFPASAVSGSGVVTCPQGIATTSTDCLSLLNNTPSTSGVPVQMSGRVRIGGSAYNSVSTLSEADSMFFEVLPATVAGTTTQTWKLGSIINGGAATYPFTVNSAGTAIFGNGGSGMTLTSNNLQLASGGSFLGSNVDASTAYKVNSNLWVSATAPTVTSAGSSPSVTNSNGTATFRINVGTGGTATTIVLGLPTAIAGWNCSGSNLTAAAANRNPTGVLLQQSSTTTTATLQYQTVATGVALAFVASDIVKITCAAF